MPNLALKHAVIAAATLVLAVGYAPLARSAEPPAGKPAGTRPAAAAPDANAPPPKKEGAAMSSLYEMKVNALDGKPQDLSAYKGKVTLVVNVASECGYTPQYGGLEKLHEELAGKGFAVLGFPSNDFGAQEPGTPGEIEQFCKKNYGVTFPMFEKVVTKPGASQAPVYAFLGQSGNLPQWNFSKYVVGKDGKVVAFFPSKVTPESPELRAAIDQALAVK